MLADRDNRKLEGEIRWDSYEDTCILMGICVWAKLKNRVKRNKVRKVKH